MSRTNPRTPLTVEIDIPITRRLKLHAVLDRNGDQIYHSRRLSDLFSWLLDNDIGEFTMLDGTLKYAVSLRSTLEPVQPL